MSRGASGKSQIEKFTLEDCLSLEHVDIISPHVLRKIIAMHGFNGRNIPKDDLLEALRSIKLMDVHHSTLQSDAVSSNAFLSVNEVIKDISHLRWQECCITDIETINSVTDFGEELPPKRFKPDRSTVVNGPGKLGSEKLIMDQKTTVVDDETESKRGGRVKKVPTKWNDYIVIGAPDRRETINK